MSPFDRIRTVFNGSKQEDSTAPPPQIVFAGNPNAGKTTLFNHLTGLRTKSSNWPGTTVEKREGWLFRGGKRYRLIDLPGLYSLEAVTEEERLARAALQSEISGPDLVVLVLDATNLERNLFLASQILELKLPVVVALNIMDEARRKHPQLDPEVLSKSLGCPVCPVVARTGEGCGELIRIMEDRLRESATPILGFEHTLSKGCGDCPYAGRYEWAESVSRDCQAHSSFSTGSKTEAIDRVITSRSIGLLCFLGVMTATFALIFWLASYPMDLLEGWISWTGGWLGRHLPEGIFGRLVTEGIIGGVGSVVVFLPQICILFFVLALLEDTGYLARAAFVMDRLMHKIGLPGKAFVPLLSAHACAIPAIMSTRVIEDRRDRLVTMLIIPLMSCSARVPVYAMVAILLFGESAWRAAVLFTGAYILGLGTALLMGWILSLTILPGRASPMVMELPPYRWPSLKNAARHMLERASIFLRTAGSLILVVSMGLWFLANYPEPLTQYSPEDPSVVISQNEANSPLEDSFIGRAGQWIEPIFAPLGFDWRISVGILTSFAARETIISTLAILFGQEQVEVEFDNGLLNAVRSATRADGTPVFDLATSLSLLVFFVLAMQCLPTNVVTWRETGSWKWAAWQIVSMSLLAYGAAWITYQLASWFG